MHGGDLKRALEICSFHTRDPPVEYSSHISRRNTRVLFDSITIKKRGSLTPQWAEDYSDIAERLSGRRALMKTTESSAAKTWLNPKSRSYAL